MNYWTQSNKNIYVAAHRGFRTKYPENTIEAFKAALTLDIDQIETDVRITKDGELVLIHDATVDRTTNGSGLVCEKTLAELKQLDAGSGTKIPTLTEFMELIKDHPTLTIDIELKEYPTKGREETAYSVCDRVVEIVEQYGFAERFVLNTFSGKLHDYIYKTYGNKYKQHIFYPKRHLGEYEIDPYSYAYCTCVFGILEGEVTAEEIKKLHTDTGVRIWAGSYANNEENINKAIEMGCELITCDNPDEVLEILKAKGLHK